ncbi:MAG: OmpA family protein [Verrucomicrobia bacterium]|nr:OmpA family protein [Verrucomicrobiota bacterium]
MKRALLFNLCLAVLLSVTGSVGCRKKPIGPTPIPTGQYGTGSGENKFPATPGGQFPGGEEVRTQPGGEGGMSELPVDPESDMLRDEAFFRDTVVYFDFDRSTVRSGERSKIETVSTHLQSNPAHKLKIEGHCDERGTEGYNLALGERRALSVRDYLINLGISSQRIYTSSWGESRPAEIGQNESAWQANRRAEFILLLPKP